MFVTLIANEACAEEQTIVLNGLPLIRITASFEGAKESKMTESQQNEYRVLITKKNGNIQQLN